MSKTLRLIALFAVIVIVCGVAAAIFAVTYTSPNTPKIGIVIDGKLKTKLKPTITINNEEVSFADYRYYFLVSKSQIVADQETEADSSVSIDVSSYWADDPDGSKTNQLKQEVEDAILDLHAWIEIGKKLGVGLGEDEKAEVASQVKEFEQQAGTDLDAILAQNYLIDLNQMQNMWELQALIGKIIPEARRLLYAENKEEWAKDYTSVEHILFEFENEEPTQKEIDAVKKKAQAIYAQIEASENPEETFAEMRELYDADAEAQADDGHTFGPEDMVEEYEVAAKDLEIGEISKPVETDHGFYIILRKPLNTDYLDANWNTLFLTKMNDILVEQKDAIRAGFEVEYADYFDQITATNVE
ncbi:MAG: peptidylprolyl isomerase [Oscillospiraceae bacterium]